MSDTRRRGARKGWAYARQAGEKAFLELGPTRAGHTVAGIAACCAALMIMLTFHFDQSWRDSSPVDYQRSGSTTTIEVTVPTEGWYALWEETPATGPPPPATEFGTTVGAKALRKGPIGLFGGPGSHTPYQVRLDGRQTIGTPIAVGLMGAGTYRITVHRGEGARPGHGPLAFGPEPEAEELVIGDGTTGFATYLTASAFLAPAAIAAATSAICAWRRRAAARKFLRTLGIHPT
ncbi:hypothetical protein [Streptomyces sp. NPDC097619]|uniref:hypothetical protein n=1 Tax=Streptomyces sp. NPDC097619 TaxID=3157228 RepID=UPI003326BC7D